MVFSDKEKIWIVEEGARQKSAVVIKREFVKHFKVSPRKAKDLKPHLFVRVIEGFRKTGAVTPRKRKARDKSVRVEENIIRVKVHYENDPKTSIRSTAKDLQLSYQSVRKILKDDPKMKPYYLRGVSLAEGVKSFFQHTVPT